MSDEYPHSGQTLATGQCIAGYTVGRLIGVGGFGEVYEVSDEDGQRWALKIMRILNKRSRRAAKRAALEAQLLKAIDHINVVRFRDSGTTDDGLVWICTELLEGESLRETMRGGRIDVERALRFGRQICNGVAQLHALDAVHRDLKPENIFVMPADVIKVLDFGIAKCQGVSLHTTRQVGTALYMAPDQLSHSGGPADPRWDVYATGLMLYEMILGRHAFVDDDGCMPGTQALVIGMQLVCDIKPIAEKQPGFPEHISSAIQKAISKDATERYGTMREFADVLRDCRRWWTAKFAVAPEALLPSELAQLKQGGAAPAATPSPVTPMSALKQTERIDPALLRRDRDEDDVGTTPIGSTADDATLPSVAAPQQLADTEPVAEPRAGTPVEQAAPSAKANEQTAAERAAAEEKAMQVIEQLSRPSQQPQQKPLLRVADLVSLAIGLIVGLLVTGVVIYWLVPVLRAQSLSFLPTNKEKVSSFDGRTRLLKQSPCSCRYPATFHSPSGRMQP